MGLEALGAIAGGLNRGIDMAQRDRLLEDQKRLQEEQMAAWRDDRQFQGNQRSRQIAEQAREDTFRDSMNAVPEVGTKSLIPGTDVGPTQDGGTVPGQFKTQTAISQARQQAEAAKAAGKFDTARTLSAWADEQGMKAASDAFQTYNLGYKGHNPYEYASGLSRVISADQSPVMVDGVEDLGNGKVRATLKNRSTGWSTTADFGSLEEVKQAALRHYDPATYSAQVKRAQDKQDKIDEINAKPLELQPGGQAYGRPDPVTGVRPVIAANNNESAAEKAARIRAGVGGTTGAGTGKAVDPNKVLNDTLEFIGKNSSMNSWTPDVTAKVQQYAFQVVQNSGGKIPPQLAGSIAIDVATNPAKLQPRVDTATGSIDMVYESPEVGEVKFTRGYASARQPVNVSPEQFKGFAAKLVETQPPGVRDKFVAAAFDSNARGELEKGVRDEISAMYLQQIQANPKARDQLVAQRDATIASTMESIGRKLDIVSGHYPKPKAASEKPAPSMVDRLTTGVGGMKKPEPSGQPSYDELMKAKSEKDKLMSDVGRMSPDRRESYLATRLPQIEDRIKFHQNYRTY